MKVKTICLLMLFSVIEFQCGRSGHQFTIWVGGSPEEVDYWQTVVNRFDKETGYNLQLIRQPSYTDQREQALVLSLESKQRDPDLFLMDVVWINQFAASGWLAQLDNFIKSDSIQLNEFFPAVVNSVDRYGGKLFALPVFLDVGLLYYRKDLLNKYGYSSPPETWDELLKQSQKVQEGERKNDPNFYGFVWQGAQYEGLICDFLEFTASNNGGIMQNGKININSKQNIKALLFMKELIQKYKISPPDTYTDMKEEDVRRSFQNGDALFERNWTYAWKLHQSSDSEVKGKIGVAILPHFDNCKSVSALGGWHIGISRYSDEKEKAAKFIQFVSSYEIQKDLLLKVGWNPGRKDVYNDKEVLRKLPQLKEMENAFNNSVARPTLPYYNQVSDIIQRYINNCIAGKLSPQSALSNIQEEINNLSKIYGNK
jgi:multiple sugar transport system substrate-binding protein